MKQKKTAAAGQALKEGLKTAVKYDDNLFCLLTEFLYVLFAEPINKDSLVEILSKLENIHMYSYVEELTLLTANFFKGMKDFEMATIFYDKMVESQLQIQRGDCLYEY